MKRYYYKLISVLLFINLFISLSIQSQVPEKMSYQAVIRDAKNSIVANTRIGMRINILRVAEPLTIVYTEEQTTTTSIDGLISINIGINPGFAQIDWRKGPYYLETETDFTGGTNYTFSNFIQLMTVPYTLHSKLAESSDSSATKAYAEELKNEIEELQLFMGVIAKDYDGNIYKTVRIGNQIWMAENLKAAFYQNGERITIITNDSIWANLTRPANCHWNYSPSYSKTYGRLYNWYAVIDTRNICPAGWHVPSNEDWDVLSDYLGGDTLAGGKLKEAGTNHWSLPNIGATNETGFNAIPGGRRYEFGTFSENGAYEEYWWSITEDHVNWAFFRNVISANSIFDYGTVGKRDGLAVRCLKD